MKTRFGHRISAALLAVLMLSSSFGLSMDVHFCGGEIKSFSFFGQAEKCEMSEAKIEKKSSKHACCQSQESTKIQETKKCNHSSEVKGNCCHNETFSIDVSDSYEGDQFTLNLNHSLVFTSHSFNTQFTFSDFKSALDYFHYYHPPPLDQDVQVLFQVFRI